jgi:putative transposase
MRVAYQYKLLPTAEQKTIMNRWLDMLRCEYNYLLAERFNWWEQNRCDINACPLICHLPELKDNPDYYSQKRNLVLLKQDRPWYKEIYSQVLQECVTRVKLAFDRFIKGDRKGNRSGRPRFKGKNRYRSFTYTQMGNEDIVENRIHLAKIGWVKLILHRPIPDGFKVKTAIVSQKADGWYITISLQDDSVPQSNINIIPTWDNSIALDLGLEKFAADSSGGFEPIPQHFRASEARLVKIQQKAAVRKKGSRARKLLYRKAAKLHQKIARQRRQFHFETAKKVLTASDVVFVEDLAVKNMNRRCKPKQDETGKFIPNGQAAKSGMNKSIADAGWSQFIDILTVKAENAGQKVIKVDPKGTSQHCSSCTGKVPKALSDRWHSCPCGLEIDRDTNSAILIKKVGLGVASLKNAQPKTNRKRSYHQVLKLGA